MSAEKSARRGSPGRRVGRSTPRRVAARPSSSEGAYEDFGIAAERVSPRSIRVRVSASPAGPLDEPLLMAYPAGEARELRESFRSGTGWTGSVSVNAPIKPGRADITQAKQEPSGVG